MESTAMNAVLVASLKSQYHATLAMLKECIERCPEAEWQNPAYTNQFWQVAYHALFFAHLYLQPRAQDFRPWPKHQANVQHADGIPGDADPNSKLPLIPEPYSKADVLEYWEFCDARIDGWVEAIDLESSDSGFHWYPISKLEHQLVNLRHTAHHTAQLADRLRAAAGVGIRWRGRGA